MKCQYDMAFRMAFIAFRCDFHPLAISLCDQVLMKGFGEVRTWAICCVLRTDRVPSSLALFTHATRCSPD